MLSWFEEMDCLLWEMGDFSRVVDLAFDELSAMYADWIQTH
jgi:hypothetical protein